MNETVTVSHEFLERLDEEERLSRRLRAVSDEIDRLEAERDEILRQLAEVSEDWRL